MADSLPPWGRTTCVSRGPEERRSLQASTLFRRGPSPGLWSLLLERAHVGMFRNQTEGARKNISLPPQILTSLLGTQGRLLFQVRAAGLF